MLAFFSQKTLKIAISIVKSKNIENWYFCTSNPRILYLNSIKMCRINFRNFDNLHCKILAFNVEKTRFFATCVSRFFDFELA